MALQYIYINRLSKCFEQKDIDQYASERGPSKTKDTTQRHINSVKIHNNSVPCTQSGKFQPDMHNTIKRFLKQVFYVDLWKIYPFFKIDKTF